MILTGKYETAHVYLFISLVILTLARHLSSKQIVKENKPRRKVIRLYKAIKGRFKWSEKEYGNDY